MKRIFIVLSCYSFLMPAYGQTDRGMVKGRLMGKQSGKACDGFQLLLPKLKRIHTTDSSGYFLIGALPYNEWTINVRYDSETTDSFKVAIAEAAVDLGVIWVNEFPVSGATERSQLPVMAFEEEQHSAGDEGNGSDQGLSMPLNTTKDAFQYASSFILGQYGFRPRGYNRATQQVYLNGILMNDLVSGNAVWGNWAGLNDVFRNQITIYGLGVQQQTLGGINGSSFFEVSAPEQAAQSKFSYSLSNRTYNNRVCYTHSSGTKRNAWTYTISMSRRWAQESYVPGTFFDGYSGFVSLGKTLNVKHSLSLSLVGSHSIKGRSGAATGEVYRLAGDQYYNANWGWQEGLKRNVRTTRSFQPMAFLQHTYNPSVRTQLSTCLFVQVGQNNNTALDWYNAIDPRPDYYRNLPGYYQPANPVTANAIAAELYGNPDRLQINWDDLYAANRDNREMLHNANGINGNLVSGNRSLYVLGSDVERLRKVALNTQMQYKVSRQISWSGGLQLHYQRSEYYRQLEDLLGGDYFVNYNQFAVQYNGKNSYAQNDLTTPDRAIRHRDRYRYSYTYTINKAWLWGQMEYNFRKVNGFIGFQGGYASYTRNGHYRNGLFPEHSMGKSQVKIFPGYKLKSGVTYKLNGRHYLFAHGWISAEDPGINNVFIAPRTRNQITDRPELQQTKSVEAGYLVHAPKVMIRAVAYATENRNVTTIQRFYNDEPEYQSFVNFVMSGLNTRHTGIECGIEYTVHPTVVLNGAIALGQAFYANSPEVQIYTDNDTQTRAGSKEVYIRNYYLGNGPQSAYTLGITYNARSYWYIKINGNYLDRSYTAINPARRSTEAAELIPATNPLYDKIFNQERLPAVFTVDLSAGKSFRFRKGGKKKKNGPSLYCNIGISNLLNNRGIRLAGFEQLRYDFTNNNPDKFPSKYIYGYGRTFFANLSIKL